MGNQAEGKWVVFTALVWVVLAFSFFVGGGGCGMVLYTPIPLVLLGFYLWEKFGPRPYQKVVRAFLAGRSETDYPPLQPAAVSHQGKLFFDGKQVVERLEDNSNRYFGRRVKAVKISIAGVKSIEILNEVMTQMQSPWRFEINSVAVEPSGDDGVVLIATTTGRYNLNHARQTKRLNPARHYRVKGASLYEVFTSGTEEPADSSEEPVVKRVDFETLIIGFAGSPTAAKKERLNTVLRQLPSSWRSYHRHWGLFAYNWHSSEEVEIDNPHALYLVRGGSLELHKSRSAE